MNGVSMTYRTLSVLLAVALLSSACGTETTAGTKASDQGRASGPATAGGGASGPGGARGSGGGAVPVVTTLVVTKAVPVTIPAVGTVEAVSSVQVRAQVTGQLSGIHFTEGQEVAKGQLLFTIDPRPFQAALQQAQAVLARDTAMATNQHAEQTRYNDLFKQGLISREQYDAQTSATQASEATLEMDRAAVNTNSLNLQYSRIPAPIAGRTGALGVHVGDIVRANDTDPMLVINQLSPIYVTFSVPGRYLADIQHYQAQRPLSLDVRTQAASMPGAQQAAPSSAAPDVQPAAAIGVSEHGRVTFIDNTVDPTTGTIKLRGLFDNPKKSLWPGLFVQATLNLATDRDAIVVPAAAVQTSQNGQYVYVVKPDRTAELRPVTVERQQGDDVVIAKGLSTGEQVVTDGQLRLTPGAHVTTQGTQS
jgi:multidrug efflux system membrane fusion protein